MSELMRLEAQLTNALGTPILLCGATAPWVLHDLTAGERAIFRELPSERRRSDWLRGRTALKRLLQRLGVSDDTSRLRFPHSTVSLTHSGTCAVAAASCAPQTYGMGVDFERKRPARPELLRFYLKPREERVIAPLPAREWLRMWTVKEALFKADLANGESWLGDYVVELPLAMAGAARHDDDATHTYRYACASYRGGFLSVALATNGEQS